MTKILTQTEFQECIRYLCTAISEDKKLEAGYWVGVISTLIHNFIELDAEESTEDEDNEDDSITCTASIDDLMERLKELEKIKNGK